jgi:hypothetical protein
MSKMSLLEMVQNILSAMNSDEVNSITDTVESQQVATEIKTTYEELYGNRQLGNFESLVTLESGSSAYPTTISMPSNVVHLKWVKYRDFRNNDQYHKVEYIEPEEFIIRLLDRVPGQFEPTTQVQLLPTIPNTYTVSVNRCPNYYTVFEDKQTLVFDSLDLSYESFLTGSSCIAWGLLSKEFQLTDDFVPDLDVNFFPHLLAEAKSACFNNVKEMPNQKEEQRARRQLVRSQIYINKASPRRNYNDGVNYGKPR